MKGICITLFVSMLISGIIASSISCKDEQGKDVDWFFAYKLPYAYPPWPAYGQGVQYLYMKPGSTNWTLSTASIKLSNSSIGYTMVQAYANASNPNLAVVAYNDEPPGLTSAEDNIYSGHTKGVLVADDKSGFWMVHSVPLYPEITSNPSDYTYPSSAYKYGQSFLCITVKAAQVNNIGLQLIYNEPEIYRYQISQNLISKYPNLVKVNNNVTITTAPFSNVAKITSKAGCSFTSFAKNGNYKKELYEDLVAPTLKTNLYVESWRVGHNLFSSNCSESTEVWNISHLNFASIGFNFTTLNDHSKWAVNAPAANQTPWICVGDINRESFQELRGGGTVCLSNAPVASSFYSLITAFDAC